MNEDRKVNADEGDQCEYCGMEFGQDEPAYSTFEEGVRITVCCQCHDAQERLLTEGTV